MNGVLVSPGIQWWSKEAREQGFPRQGFKVGGFISLQCISFNLGIGQLRLWVFIGWGDRWADLRRR